MYAEVAFPISLRKIFTYSVPENLKEKIKPGQRALVPFGRERKLGFIVSTSTSSEVKNAKELLDLIDEEPVITKELLELTRWVSEYYYSSWGECLKAALPSELQVRSLLWVHKKESPLLEYEENKTEFYLKEKKILNALQDKSPQKITSLEKRTGSKGLYSALHFLEEKGKVELFYELDKPKSSVKYEKMVSLKGDLTDSNKLIKTYIDTLKKKSSKEVSVLELLLKENRELSIKEINQTIDKVSGVLMRLEKKGLVKSYHKEILREPFWKMDIISTLDFSFNPEQKQVMESLEKALEEGRHHPFLLYGITGSGKTLIYIEIIRKVLEKEKEALVLVPEISLTPQIIHRFKAVFGDKVCTYHSRLSAGERFDAWRGIKQGKFKVVIGTRSAIFLPFLNPGIIIVDEEQDFSYKQKEPDPKYNARDLALVRGKMNKALVILGSATPSLESFYNAVKGKYSLLQLTSRVEQQPLPRVNIVDLKEERKKGNYSVLSHKLSSELKRKIERGEQVILFLNRRGFSSFIKCEECGYIFRCPHCEISLNFHRSDFTLRCHYCNYRTRLSPVCPKCSGSRFIYKGMGTQRIEEEVKKLIPEANLRRMDQDTTNRKNSHREILSSFASRDFNLLLGTQMVTKGLDFPDVTLVGVILADTSLDFPDFRAKEKTFQLLTQVAGRAGRGKLGGEVILQTYYPEDWAIKLSAEQNFLDFYEREVKEREELFYPPFSRLVLIRFQGKEEKKVRKIAEDFGKKLSSSLKSKGYSLKSYQILGPAPAPLVRIKDHYRYQILIKTKDVRVITKKIDLVFEKGKDKIYSGVRISVEVDPVEIM
ncbi:MAG: primosomal protein N' [candidate division Zixibacteria bacterium]|nr:primosomal protein N' [candidate division Zixibacteria bacterium]